MARITLYLDRETEEQLARRSDPAADRLNMAGRGSRPRRQLGRGRLPHAGGDPQGAAGGGRAALRVRRCARRLC